MLAVQAAGSLLSHYLGRPALTADPVYLGMAQILMTNLLNGLILLFIYRTVSLKYRSPFWLSLKWRGSTAAPPGLFLALGALLALAMGALSSRIPGIEELPVSELLRHTQTALLLGVTAIAVAPLVEEVVFRGFIFPVLERRWGPVAAVLLTAAMFTSLHVTQLWGSWMAVSLILLVGLVLSLVRALTGALRPAFLLHLAYNATLCLLSLIGSGVGEMRAYSSPSPSANAWNSCSTSAWGGVAGVDVDPVEEAEGLSLGQEIAAIPGLVVVEIVQSEGVGGKQGIAPGVPVGGVAKAAGMVQNGHAQGLGAHLGGVVHPAGRLAPASGRAPGALGVLHQQSLLLGEGLGQPHPEGSLLGVPELDRGAGGGELHLQVHHPRLGPVVNPDFPGLGEQQLAAGSRPVVAGLEHAHLGSAFDALEFLVPDGSAFRRLTPEVHPVDVSVGEPDAGVVAVVPALSGNILDHGIAPGDHRPGGRAQGEEDGLVVALEMVGGEGAFRRSVCLLAGRPVSGPRPPFRAGRNRRSFPPAPPRPEQASCRPKARGMRSLQAPGRGRLEQEAVTGSLEVNRRVFMGNSLQFSVPGGGLAPGMRVPLQPAVRIAGLPAPS